MADPHTSEDVERYIFVRRSPATTSRSRATGGTSSPPSSSPEFEGNRVIAAPPARSTRRSASGCATDACAVDEDVDAGRPRRSRDEGVPMDKLLIRGGRRLHGEVTISGAKNAALPELCAALLTAEPVTLHNVPRLQDVATMLKLLRNMGVGSSATSEPGGVTHRRRRLDSPEAPYELVKTMRARSWCWARCWRASARRRCRCPAAAPSARGRWTSTSRACRRWARRSASSTATSIAKAEARLKGARITTDMVTVTGTENLLMAADAGRRRDGARERRAGARNRRPGRDADRDGRADRGRTAPAASRIQGVERCAAHRTASMPDRIEAGTFLCAVAAAGGDVRAAARHAPTTSKR